MFIQVDVDGNTYKLLEVFSYFKHIVLLSIPDRNVQFTLYFTFLE